MLGRLLKPFLPRGLYGRAALIVFFPVLAILLVFSVAFIQRHYDGVTRQMTGNFVLVVDHILDRLAQSPDPEAEARALAQAFALDITRDDAVPEVATGAGVAFYDLSGQLAERELRAGLSSLRALTIDDRDATIWVDSGTATWRIAFSLSRVSARNPHQLMVLMIVIGLFMGLISLIYLKNQMRPIQRLATAAEAFGRGTVLPLRISGATEVRLASRAFLEMRERIERHIEQRTLLLSGVSHDLRTPLTRMRLAVSMLSDEPEAEALLRDLREMEHLIDQFLQFARTEAGDSPVLTDLGALLRARCDALTEAERAALEVEMSQPGPFAVVRPHVLARAFDNLLGNALRYGTRAHVALRVEGGNAVVEIEDDGPGIPPDQVEAAIRPFVRLDAARGASRGGGVGLGLSIVADAMRSHGGRLVLDQGVRPGLGGLKARLILPLSRVRGADQPPAVTSQS